MFKLTKYFILILFVVLFSYLIFNSVHAEYLLNDPNSDPSLDLKTIPEKVIDSEILYSEKTQSNYVRYLYISDSPTFSNFLYSPFKNYSNVEIVSPSVRRFYSVPLVYKDLNNDQYLIKAATTTIEAFDLQMKATPLSFLKYSLFGYPVIAATQFDAGFSGSASDQSCTTFANCRAGDGDNHRSDITHTVYHSTGGGVYDAMERALVFIDTSGVGTNIPNEGHLMLFRTDIIHAFDDSAVVTEGFSAATDSVANGDYQLNIGATLWSDDAPDISTMAADYIDFSINETGLAGINTSGYSKFSVQTYADQNNNEPAPFSGYVYFGFFGTTDCTPDTNCPYLELTYEATPPEATTTPIVAGYGLNHLEFALMLFLFIAFFLLIALVGAKIINWFRILWRF